MAGDGEGVLGGDRDAVELDVVNVAGVDRPLAADDDASASAQGKYWVFTVNNPSDEDWAGCSALFVQHGGDASYVILGNERGAGGTPHIQGYVEFVSNQRRRTLSKIPGLTRAWMAIRRGTSAQAANYCRKSGDWLEHGTPHPVAQGRRRDLEECRELIIAGVSELDLANTHFAQWCVHGMAFKKYKCLLDQSARAMREVTVIVLWGRPRTGKSLYAWTKYPDLFSVPDSDELKWFDGYDGQATVLIDDYQGRARPGLFKKLLDRYPMVVKVHNGYVPWKPSTVIITSNVDPQVWHPQAEDQPAILERLTYQMEFTERRVYSVEEIDEHLFGPGERVEN